MFEQHADHAAGAASLKRTAQVQAAVQIAGSTAVRDRTARTGTSEAACKALITSALHRLGGYARRQLASML